MNTIPAPANNITIRFMNPNAQAFGFNIDDPSIKTLIGVIMTVTNKIRLENIAINDNYIKTEILPKVPNFTVEPGFKRLCFIPKDPAARWVIKGPFYMGDEALMDNSSEYLTNKNALNEMVRMNITAQFTGNPVVAPIAIIETPKDPFHILVEERASIILNILTKEGHTTHYNIFNKFKEMTISSPSRVVELENIYKLLDAVSLPFDVDIFHAALNVGFNNQGGLCIPDTGSCTPKDDPTTNEHYECLCPKCNRGVMLYVTEDFRALLAADMSVNSTGAERVSGGTSTKTSPSYICSDCLERVTSVSGKAALVEGFRRDMLCLPPHLRTVAVRRPRASVPPLAKVLEMEATKLATRNKSNSPSFTVISTVMDPTQTEYQVTSIQNSMGGKVYHQLAQNNQLIRMAICLADKTVINI